MFSPTTEAMERWDGWWRIVRADQWGVFFTGAVLGMALPALLYVTFLPRGTDIQGLGISAALAFGVGAKAGPLLGGVVAFLGAWILFKTQLDNLEGMTRALTDILWTGSRACAAGAAATCAPCTTRCWRSLSLGASSRCAWRSRSSCSS